MDQEHRVFYNADGTSICYCHGFKFSAEETAKMRLGDTPRQRAKEISTRLGYVSISKLQREMRLTYSLTCELVEALIAEGFCEAGLSERRVHELTHKEGTPA